MCYSRVSNVLLRSVCAKGQTNTAAGAIECVECLGMYVCVRVRVCACVFACVRVCACVNTHTHTHTHTHKHTHTCRETEPLYVVGPRKVAAAGQRRQSGLLPMGVR